MCRHGPLPWEVFKRHTEKNAVEKVHVKDTCPCGLQAFTGPSSVWGSCISLRKLSEWCLLCHLYNSRCHFDFNIESLHLRPWWFFLFRNIVVPPDNPPEAKGGVIGIGTRLKQCSFFPEHLSLPGACRNVDHGFGPGVWSVTALLASFQVSPAQLVQGFAS